MSAPVTFAVNEKAFGDGSHPTTQMVLAALESLDPQVFTPRIACDMGCGSGILSLAIARLFHCPVVAVDVARESVEMTKENAMQNGLYFESQSSTGATATGIFPIHADGFADTAIAARAPYDLIVMNILAEPLLALAADAVCHLSVEGVLVLSGLFRWQEEPIRTAYHTLGLECSARLASGEWVALVFQKP